MSFRLILLADAWVQIHEANKHSIDESWLWIKKPAAFCTVSRERCGPYTRPEHSRNALVMLQCSSCLQQQPGKPFSEGWLCSRWFLLALTVGMVPC